MNWLVQPTANPNDVNAACGLLYDHLCPNWCLVDCSFCLYYVYAW